MSTAFASVVLLIDPPGYLKVPPESTTVLPAVASLVKINVNEVALLAVLFGVDRVNVQLPVSVAVNTLPLLCNRLSRSGAAQSSYFVREGAREKRTRVVVNLTYATTVG